MRRGLLVLLVLIAGLGAASAARAVVVTDGSGGTFGVALVPGTDRAAGGISSVTSPPPCQDPWLASDLGGPILDSSGLCYHGGAVLHRNEVFDLTWDPLRRDWSTTRDYVEHYLRTVADSSGTQGSPYALTQQYQDAGGRALNQSTYAGGCIDYGSRGGAACQFGDSSGTGAGDDYPPGDPSTGGCTPRGSDQFADGGTTYAANDVCVTDAQIQRELSTMISQQGLTGRTQSGYQPLMVVMTPHGVVDCLDGRADSLCSANGVVVPPIPTLTTASSGGSLPPGTYTVRITYVLPGGESAASVPQQITTTGSAATSSGGTSQIYVDSPPAVAGATGYQVYITQAGGTQYYLYGKASIGARTAVTALDKAALATPPETDNREFCSYHSSLTVDGTRIPYVVVPWVALTGCDEPDAPQIPENPPVDVLANAIGARLVSPLSQSTVATITNPFLDGWSALDGSEMNDNGGCAPLGHSLDNITLDGATYQLQRAFNNGGVIVDDPNAPRCASLVNLQAEFVAPSAVDAGDVVEFDGSKTVSTLVVPRAGYRWNFGDGTSATGPSVVHTFTKDGTYTASLTVTDRGGFTNSTSQTVQVGPPGTTTTRSQATLKARLQLMPQSLRSVLRSGLAVRITSNLNADGITTLSLPKSYAKQAHLHVSRSASVVIGRGTVAGVKAGTMTIHVKIPSATVRRLQKLRRLALTISVSLRGPSSTRETLDAAGRY